LAGVILVCAMAYRAWACSCTPLIYFTNFGASNDSPVGSYINQYITYLQTKGSNGYNNTGNGAGPLVGNFTPTGTPDSPCGSTSPFPTTNITGVLAHSPTVSLISLRITCDSIRASGCTVAQIEADIQLIYNAAQAVGVRTFVQTPQPCEADPPTTITTAVQTLYAWVLATYPSNFIDMTTTFSLADGTTNPTYFSGIDYTVAAQMLAFQRLQAAVGY
jgi:hypothetical protein